MSQILPQKPLLVMYNEYTDELGISSDNYDLVVIANFIVFNRYQPDAEDYEEYSGGYSWTPEGPVRLGYIPNGTMTVEKNEEWQVIGVF